MPKNAKNPVTKSSKNVVDLLKPLVTALAPKVIEKIDDAAVKDTVSRTATLVRGVAQANSGTKPLDIANKALLDEVGITPAKVAAMGQDALALLADAADRDAKKDAYHEAVAQVTADCEKLDENLARVASKLRGSFGNTSQDLTNFGVAPLGGGHSGGRKPAKAGDSEETSADQKKQSKSSKKSPGSSDETSSTT